MSEITRLRYLLQDRNAELLAAENKLSDTQYEMKFMKKELDEYKQRDARAYDRYVLSTGEPCCEDANRVGGMTDAIEGAIEVLSFAHAPVDIEVLIKQLEETLGGDA